MLQPDEYPASREDEVESSTVELEWELVDVCGVVGDIGGTLPGDLGAPAGGSDASDQGAGLGQVRGRLAGCALEVQHMFAFDVGQELTDLLRDPELTRHRR